MKSICAESAYLIAPGCTFWMNPRFPPSVRRAFIAHAANLVASAWLCAGWLCADLNRTRGIAPVGVPLTMQFDSRESVTYTLFLVRSSGTVKMTRTDLYVCLHALLAHR
jgi:hypothetical protein